MKKLAFKKSKIVFYQGDGKIQHVNSHFISSKVNYLRKLFSFKSQIKIYFLGQPDFDEKKRHYMIPEWVVGFNKKKTVFISVDSLDRDCFNSIDKLIVHEISHIMINKITGKRCPLWLNEGLALYFAEQLNIEHNEYIPDKNIYDCSYSDDFYYDRSGYITCELIRRYSELEIISRIKKNSDIFSDEILGRSNMNSFINEIMKMDIPKQKLK
jgi:hypothetical protein